MGCEPAGSDYVDKDFAARSSGWRCNDDQRGHFPGVILNLCNNAFDAMRDKLKFGRWKGVRSLPPKVDGSTALQKDK